MSLFGDIAGLAAINTAYNKLGQVGTSALQQSSALAQDLYNKGVFQPFAVRSNLGTTNVLASGSMGSYLGGKALTSQQRMFDRAIADVTGDTAGAIQAGGIGANLLGRTTGALDATIPGYSGLADATDRATAAGMGFMQQAQMPVAQREQQVFDRIRAAQAPEEARRRLELEERLATQGRLGVSTNLYGGTPEQLALSKAQAEAQNTAMLQAMQQARAEQAQAGALGQQFGAAGRNTCWSAAELTKRSAGSRIRFCSDRARLDARS